MSALFRLAVALAGAGLPSLALAAGTLNFSFAGRPPPLPTNASIDVAPGVDALKTVVFDTATAGKVQLRPVRPDEKPTADLPFYRFEAQPDGSQRFYELADPAYVARLDAESKLAVATDLGKTTHRSIVQALARSGALQKCVPPAAKALKPTLTFYVVVAADGTEQRALFLPEGSVTECLQRTWTERKHLPPGVASTFRWTVNIN